MVMLGLLLIIIGIFLVIFLLHRIKLAVEDRPESKKYTDKKREIPYSKQTIEWELKLDKLTDHSCLFDKIDGISEMMRQYNDSEYQQVRKALVDRDSLEIPFVSKENGFSSSRFLGRMVGFSVAALDSLRKLCQYNRSYPGKCKTKVIFSSAFDYKEEKAVEKLIRKILSIDKVDTSTEEYRLGLYEGTAILLHGEAEALYCSHCYFDNFEQAIMASVNHGGDSDSTGAVTGR